MIMRRGGIFYFIVVILMTVMLMRCFFLSSGGNAQRAQAVIGGRESELILYRTKGIIYDENLKPIAGEQPCWYIIVNPRDFDHGNLERLLLFSGAEKNEVLQKLKKETPFVLTSMEQPDTMTGIVVVEGVYRYSGVAQHLLGYLDRAGEVGLSGVEKEYNEYLNLFASSVLATYSADAVQGAIAGLGISAKECERSENGVVLTLNKELCVALEDSMKKHVSKGAAVVMECNSGELKAVCSTPEYDEADIVSYMDSTEGELLNRAFGAQTVGSVFKIVVAACALEAGMESFSYTCEGGIKINDWTFACHQHTGHGTIGLREAFGQSCNSYFIALGQLLGYDRIAEMAARFGFGEEKEVLGSIKAAGGNIPQDEGALSLANFCIGQGALTASPLQITLMTSVVSNGGILPTVFLSKGLYLEGTIRSEGKTEAGMRILTEEVAEKLRQYCVYTVEEGTGKSAMPAQGSAGGKTASAQTGIIKDGTEQLNVCFTGFYPAENPRYAITVFAEDGVSGGKTCAPVFREICDFIAENNLTDRETVVY